MTYTPLSNLLKINVILQSFIRQLNIKFLTCQGTPPSKITKPKEFLSSGSIHQINKHAESTLRLESKLKKKPSRNCDNLA